ncbi:MULTISPECIES: capsular polysaccharide biosynthesis protein [Chelativorans]|jgi:capsular polysaccharide export protein|uniref:Capsule polysaccharide biosynthesis n=1 Tax=Chelativorans sp. (strain BNC1) TaxID=266779 RepID=Q11EP3_CHESB|nr:MULTISPECIES: capsular polysaccharide biosynthesis protein [Chelativorans]
MNSKRHSGGHVLASRGIAKIPHLQVFLDGWGSAVVGWGRKPSGHRAIALASKRKLPFLLLEDGFLRSVERSGPPLSLIVDDIGIYYDASAPSRLETLVREPLSEEQVRRTLLLMRAWRDGHISKYNHARDYDGPLPSRFVLVVDQTFGDASVRHGLADASSFQGMLQAALDENPECSVLVKSHPDVVRRRKRGYFEPRKLADHPRVKFILDDCRPARLLEQAEAVYTVTSQLGFEALIWGKRVRCFGMPFYAGWGLTDDALAAPARRKSATLEQLVHASLVRYPRYRDLHGETPADVEAVIEHVTLQTRMRARFSPELHALGFSWWKAPILKRFLAGSKLNFVGRMSAVPPNATVALWGARHIGETPPGTKIIRIEDGFLRSVGLGSELSRPVSWICDEEGIYYDASRPSRLERILSDTDFDQLLLDRAGKLRQAILRARLTKYNLGAPRWVRPARAVRVILVPGQVESDASLRFGAPGIKTNLELLKAVRQANPDAYVVYKPHPDVAAGVRHQPGNTRWSDLCDEVVVTADMAQLLEEVDEVHTLTSLTGFEALLRELPVTCYGQPFYAGWGLSCDMIPIERRKRRLSLDELVAGSLILYPTYHSRSSAGFITPEQAVAELSAWRSASAGEPSMVRKLLRPLLYLRDLTRNGVGTAAPSFCQPEHLEVDRGRQ